MKGELIELPYLGSRDYIHGSDIASAVLAHFPAEKVKNFDIRISGKINQALRLVVGGGLEAQDAKGVGSLNLDGEARKFRLYPEGGVVARRVEYDEFWAVDSSKINLEVGYITFDQDVNFSLCRVITALQKTLLNALYPKVEGKWVFARLELGEIPVLELPVTLKLSRNLNFKLVRSEIFFAGRSVGFISFSLVEGAQW